MFFKQSTNLGNMFLFVGPTNKQHPKRIQSDIDGLLRGQVREIRAVWRPGWGYISATGNSVGGRLCSQP